MSFTQEFKDKVSEFCTAASELCNNYHAKHHQGLPYKTVLKADYGKKRVRIVKFDQYPDGSEMSGSAWCFLDPNGDVLKAATWAAPAKHARANIYNDDNMGLGTKIGPYGPNYLKM